MKTYLSGGIEYAEKFGMDWRNDLEAWIKKEINHEVFNPTHESRNYFSMKFPDFKREQLKEKTQEDIRKIVGELIRFECNEIIDNCDYIICYWDSSCQKGAGTQGELTIAKYFNKPVYMVTSIAVSNIPSWIIGCSTFIFNSFDDLKKFLKSNYIE
jgi:hypothetical protein